MDDASSEISTSRLEVATPVCSTLDEVRAELVRLRCEAGEVAARKGCRILAMATHPFSSWEDQRLSPGERYLSLFERWGMLALQQLITGCHVHVAVDDPELTIAVLDRVRPWLPVLVAFDALVADLVRAGAIDDATHLYWDARPSVRYPTLEFRVGDVCPSVDVAVLYAALARSLTRTFVAAAQREKDAAPDVRPEVLRIARWRAARHG